jgi:hypothetical protein
VFSGYHESPSMDKARVFTTRLDGTENTEGVSGGGFSAFVLANVLYLASGVAQSLIIFQLDVIGLSRRTENGISSCGNALGSLLVLLWFPSLWRQMRKIHFVLMTSYPCAPCPRPERRSVGVENHARGLGNHIFV